MSIVYLPTCPRCKSMMRQVRVCVRETTRYRVFECLRCYADLMWAPELRRNEDVAVERGVVQGGSDDQPNPDRLFKRLWRRRPM
jgi:hypothetical protein